jgi:hypothetical protein
LAARREDRPDKPALGRDLALVVYAQPSAKGEGRARTEGKAQSEVYTTASIYTGLRLSGGADERTSKQKILYCVDIIDTIGILLTDLKHEYK